MAAPMCGEQRLPEAVKLRIALLATAIFAVIIAVAGLAPISGSVPGSDKLHHALGFAVLTIPTAIARPFWAPIVFLGACAYGGVLELLQPTFGRAAELNDLWADAAGAAAGSVIGACIAVMVRNTPRPAPAIARSSERARGRGCRSATPIRGRG